MKKLVIVLLAVFLLAGCDQANPEQFTAPATEATAAPTTVPTTAHTTSATTAPTTAPTTSPTTTPTTEPTTEPLDENALSQEELDFFKDMLSAVPTKWADIPGRKPVNYYNRLLWSEFESPEQINIRRLFYDQDLDENWELTEAEKTYLSKFEYVPLQLSVVRVSAEKIDKVLMECLGLTLEQTDKAGMETMVYFADTDCYYSAKGDTGACTLTIHRGTWLEEGKVELEYTQDGFYHRILTLQETDSGYIALSNLPAPSDG